MNPDTTPTDPAPCTRCGTITTTPTAFRAGGQCDACWKASQDERKRKEHAESEARLLVHRTKTWASICPDEFRDIQPERLPDPSLLTRTMAWQYGPRGLLLHGRTGLGKTRVAFQILRREHFADHKVGVIDALAIGVYLGTMGKGGMSDAMDWLGKRVALDVLLLDDPFKSAITPRVEEVLFILLDQRIAHRRPTLITTNDDAASLAARISQDRAEPLLRRIREFFQVISCV